MSIGSTIKQLRREQNITQEQLAEYLGITSRAISQWECDRTTPDISQIPALCHIFGVSSDTLLGIDIAKNEETINEYLENAQNSLHQGHFEECADILRKAYRQFPRSYKIMERLSNALVCVNSRKGINEYDEVFELCNRILSECTESTIRYQATETLAVAYGYSGKTEEMLNLAKQMPHSYFSYENFMLYRWKGDADFEERQQYMSYLINQMLQMITCLSGHMHDDNSFIYSTEERLSLYKLQIDLLALLFSEGDYQYAAQYGENACRLLIMLYLKESDYENAWHWLEKYADFAIHFDTYDFEATHTSPILSGYSDGGWIMEANGNDSRQLLDWLLNDKITEALRSDSRFDELVNRLKKYARKP